MVNDAPTAKPTPKAKAKPKPKGKPPVTKGPDYDLAEIVSCFSHEEKIAIWRIWEPGQLLSPSTIAELTKRPVGRVSYHIRLMSSKGAIALVRTEPRRGALEHFYRPTMAALEVQAALGLAPALAERKAKLDKAKAKAKAKPEPLPAAA